MCILYSGVSYIIIISQMRKINRNHQYESYESRQYNNINGKHNRIKKKKNITYITPSILVLYTICGENHFLPPYICSQIKFKAIHCNKEKNDIDGHEAGIYLNYIINNYDNPSADVYLFMHGHNTAWHHINPLRETLLHLYLSKYLKDELFGGYQCYWNFEPTFKTSNNYTIDMFNSIFHNTSISTIPPNEFSYPCCGTFWVKTSQIKKRQKEDYVKMLYNMEEWGRNNINNTIYKNDVSSYSGRIFEMMWNVIFTNSSISKIPPYCDLINATNIAADIPLS